MLVGISRHVYLLYNRLCLKKVSWKVMEYVELSEKKEKRRKKHREL